MNRQAHSTVREILVGEAIRDVVSELRMVEVADYIAYVRLGHVANLADLVESAAERYFMPGTLRLGHGGDVELDWDSQPSIKLDLELRPRGATVYFTLTLAARTAAVDVNYVAFEAPRAAPEENTAFLEAAIEGVRIRKSDPVGHARAA
jgi:hypothetical protein